MRWVILGLTVSSSWGNGHATLWRGLIRSLVRRGHAVTFVERDLPFYAAHRDLVALPGLELVLYDEWSAVRARVSRALEAADVAIVTSYCPDAASATDAVLEASPALRVFYDLDAPVTLERLERGEAVEYLGARGLADFDLVLSYAGGPALEALRARLGARRVRALYGSVDPEAHRPVPVAGAYRGDLSYLGTYAEDRQPALERLFLEPARRLPRRRFVIGGSQYPPDFPWAANIAYVSHVPPPDHASFYSSSTLTLNVTRRAMVDAGWCPSGRLFEAAACGRPIVTDAWPGIERFFAPGREILVAETADDVVRAITSPPAVLEAIGRAARHRVLDEHTAEHRAAELEALVVDRSGDDVAPSSSPATAASAAAATGA
jgi:spore maturation protein CgeB